MPNLNEAERLDALRRLNLLDTEDNEAFDRITRLASRLFNVPVALVTLIDEDRQWFKSRVGTQVRETPVEYAFCTYAIKSDDVMVVPNMEQDQRFLDNPLVVNDPSIRFYAGAPLVTREGYGIGTMCVLDTKPREMSAEDQQTLSDLAAMVMAQIDLTHAIGHVDAFSGLPNRNQLFEDLDDLSHDQKHEGHLLMVIDIISGAQMEEIMRSLGSTHCDALIRESSKLVRDVIGQETKIYHLDTARYVCVLPDEKQKNWQRLINRLTDCFLEPISCDGIPVDVDLSIGVAPFKLGDIIGPDIVRMAVTAALDAREAKKNFAIYSSDTDQAHQRSFTLLSDVPNALKATSEFHLAYQPKIHLRDKNVLSAEALLRWTHPTLGNIPPGEFIPLVEQTALAEPLTQWVIHAALAQIAAWRSDGLQVKVSVNVSAHNLEEKDFADKLAAALTQYDVAPKWLELEFTESALMRNGAGIIEQLHAIRMMGVEIAIDDFGTGYSNFSYLQKIPATVVKLDQSMIRSLGTNPRDQTIVRTMIAMAHELDYSVVAEGVETRVEYDLLAAWGCDEIQGYHIAKPLTPVDFVQWLAKKPT